MFWINGRPMTPDERMDGLREWSRSALAEHNRSPDRNTEWNVIRSSRALQEAARDLAFAPNL